MKTVQHSAFGTSQTKPAANDSKFDGSKTHQIEALLLNCMDFRLVDEVTRYMKSRGLTDQYDQITLAGAAIGVLTDKRSAWGETFWQHVTLARELHNIKKIIVIDHRDCGACKAFIRSDCATDRDTEFAIHQKWLTRLAQEIHRREPELRVELLLMDLDGSVEEVSV